jgi:dephospho-CoA kinase
MARQASRADRLARADHVIDNSGTPDDLRAQIDDVWDWIAGRRAAPADPAVRPGRRPPTP